jgi:MoxR-like ATPase
MNIAYTLTPAQLTDFLLNVATVRPVFIWGAPGIGKSSLVQEFAAQVGLDCVSLLGSQLAPEDLIGVPQIVDGKSRFCPPATIARDEAYCLFLDELNACSHEVQKAFYSLIHERRLGEYELPAGSIVIGAGNRAQDSAIVRPMSSALVNRMVRCSSRPPIATGSTGRAAIRFIRSCSSICRRVPIISGASRRKRKSRSRRRARGTSSAMR